MNQYTNPDILKSWKNVIMTSDEMKTDNPEGTNPSVEIVSMDLPLKIHEWLKEVAFLQGEPVLHKWLGSHILGIRKSMGLKDEKIVIPLIMPPHSHPD